MGMTIKSIQIMENILFLKTNNISVRAWKWSIVLNDGFNIIMVTRVTCATYWNINVINTSDVMDNNISDNLSRLV